MTLSSSLGLRARALSWQRFFLLVSRTRRGAESAQAGCGTVLSPEGAQLGIERELRGDYLLDPRDDGLRQVRMAVHVVRTDAGTGGLQEQEVANSLEEANEDFAPLGISFVLDGAIDYIDSDWLPGARTRASY